MPRISIGGTRELSITTNISGQSVHVASGHIHIVSGEVVSKVSGETVISKISGEIVKAEQQGTWGVQVSGEVTAKVSGETVIAKVSGETVVAEISGQVVDIVTPTDIIIQSGYNPLVVPSSATALQSGDCISVTIKALSANSGDIYVGGYNTGQAPASGVGLLLEPGEAINIDIDNIGKVQVYAAVSGDRVTYIANN